MNISPALLELNSIGCKECRPKYLAALQEHYTKHGETICADCNIRLVKNRMRLLDCKKPSCQPVADSAPKSADYLCPACAEHFGKLQKHLTSLNIPFAVNHRLVRGFDYYTRTVFEVQPAGAGSQGSLGGGGRYDGLIEELGGKPTPGVGFGIGVDRVILQLKEQQIPVPAVAKPAVFIADPGEAAQQEAIKLAASLRRAGVGVIESFGVRSLKAQLKHANTIGIARTVIIGDEEIKAGVAVLRDMATSQQETVPIDQLQDRLR